MKFLGIEPEAKQPSCRYAATAEGGLALTERLKNARMGVRWMKPKLT